MWHWQREETVAGPAWTLQGVGGIVRAVGVDPAVRRAIAHTPAMLAELERQLTAMRQIKRLPWPDSIKTAFFNAGMDRIHKLVSDIVSEGRI